MDYKNSSERQNIVNSRITELFAPVYITLISIIQATAFGYFLYRLSQDFVRVQDSPLWYSIYGLALVTVFFVIVIIWFEYMIGSITFIWKPGLADCFIPFLFGITECSLIASCIYYVQEIDKLYYWYFSFAGVCIIAIWAYRNMYFKAKKEEVNDAVFNIIENPKWYRNFILINKYLSTSISLVFIIMGLISVLLPIKEYIYLIFNILALVIFIGFIFRGYLYWEQIIKAEPNSYKHEIATTNNKGMKMLSSNGENINLVNIKNPWFWLIAVLGFAFIVFLGWREGIAIAFAVLSIIVATYFASRSLSTASRAFQLTRASQRPFLNISRIYAQFDGDGIHPSPIRYFIIGVGNTGNFPADQVSISFDIWKVGDSDKHKFNLQEKDTTIYFPNEGNPNLHFLEADIENKLIINVGEKLQVRIEIDYYNKLAQRKHKTIRSYQAEYNKEASYDPIPIPEEDYWD